MDKASARPVPEVDDVKTLAKRDSAADLRSFAVLAALDVERTGGPDLPAAVGMYRPTLARIRMDRAPATGVRPPRMPPESGNPGSCLRPA
ncbi:hypothetical protein ABZY45_25060 [Streptomyces sp. NPDC006516]|uniref:hypothetical protein n=1 Tax=Streptomyces sp. NPDC006516 TaxID=3154309 RepID=UPI0033BAE16B